MIQKHDRKFWQIACCLYFAVTLQPSCSASTSVSDVGTVALIQRQFPAQFTIRQSAIDHYDAGVDRHHAGELDKAIDEYKEAIRLRPEFREAWYNLAQVYFKQHNYDSAIESFNEASRLTTTPDDAFMTSASTAMCFIRKNDDKNAEDYFKRALESKPAMENTLINNLWLNTNKQYAQLLRRNDRIAEAERYEKLVEAQ